MFQRLLTWVRSDVWRVVAIGLGVVLVVVVLVSTVGGAEPDTDPAPEAGDAASSPSGTDGSSGTGSADTASAPEESGSASSDDEGFLAIKIDNAPAARPLVGIGGLSLLIEVPVEGGITRFTAFYSRNGSGVVGPIRSLRPVDADLLPPLAVHVVSTGGQPFVLQAVEATGIQLITPILFDQFQSGGRSAPYDTFLDLDILLPLIGGSDLNAIGLPAGDLPSASGTALSLEVPIGSAEFRYEDGAYVRYEAGEQFQVLDSLDGQLGPLVHETVIVMKVAERPAGYEDSNGAPVPTFDVIGSGELLVFRDGEVVEGTWTRSAQADPFVFLDTGGNPFGIPEGSIYLALVPRDQEVIFGS